MLLPERFPYSQLGMQPTILVWPVFVAGRVDECRCSESDWMTSESVKYAIGFIGAAQERAMYIVYVGSESLSRR